MFRWNLECSCVLWFLCFKSHSSFLSLSFSSFSLNNSNSIWLCSILACSRSLSLFCFDSVFNFANWSRFCFRSNLACRCMLLLVCLNLFISFSTSLFSVVNLSISSLACCWNLLLFRLICAISFLRTVFSFLKWFNSFSFCVRSNWARFQTMNKASTSMMVHMINAMKPKSSHSSRSLFHK